MGPERLDVVYSDVMMPQHVPMCQRNGLLTASQSRALRKISGKSADFMRNMRAKCTYILSSRLPYAVPPVPTPALPVSPGTTHSPSVLAIMTSTLAPRNRSLQGHPGAPAERQHRAPRPPKTHPAAADRSAGGHALPGSHAKAERGRSALHARITIARIAGGFVLPVGPGGSPGRGGARPLRATCEDHNCTHRRRVRITCRAGRLARPGAERGRSALHARITIARIAGGFVLPVGPGGSPGRVRSEAAPRYMRGSQLHASPEGSYCL